MSFLFQNQDFGLPILKIEDLPVFITSEFRFCRCLRFRDEYYGRTISELHAGNLRDNTPENRYAKLFPGKKISYWSDSPETARAEVKYHRSGNNLLTFFAYDDASSTFPTLPDIEPLIIIDGRDKGFSEILDKVEKDIKLTPDENIVVNDIARLEPDCLAFKSLRRPNGLNYLFFEKGFRKLALRGVRLRLGDSRGKNGSYITCASGSDYSPHIDSYGKCFMPIARVVQDEQYSTTVEYKTRYKFYHDSLKKIMEQTE